MPTHEKVGVNQNYNGDDVSVAALFNSWARIINDLWINSQ